MGYTIGSIFTRVRAKLNDQLGQVFTDDVLLPFAQDAADELQLELESYGLLVLEKISDPIIIPQKTGFVPGQYVSMSQLGLLPTDMLEPQKLEERLSGTTDLFTDMVRRMWEPNILLTDSLRYWDYREEDIFFVGATTNRDVRIHYLKRIVTVVDSSSMVNVNNSQLFMINKTAALAAADIGENPTRAAAKEVEAGKFLNKLISIGVKSKQGTRTRRRPFVISSRRRWV